VARALQLRLGDLINRFRVAPPRPGAPAEQNAIQFGFAAMKMEGPWFLPQLWGPKAARQGGLPYDVAAMPRGTEQQAVHLQHGHTVNAATGAQHRPGAPLTSSGWYSGCARTRRRPTAV
jgi:hypothetical protein